jgi:hypothetical protein
VPVSFLGSEAVVFETNDGADLIDEFGRVHGYHLGVSLPRNATRPIVDILQLGEMVNLNKSTNGGIIGTAVNSATSC